MRKENFIELISGQRNCGKTDIIKSRIEKYTEECDQEKKPVRILFVDCKTDRPALDFKHVHYWHQPMYMGISQINALQKEKKLGETIAQFDKGVLIVNGFNLITEERLERWVTYTKNSQRDVIIASDSFGAFSPHLFQNADYVTMFPDIKSVAEYKNRLPIYSLFELAEEILNFYDDPHKHITINTKQHKIYNCNYASFYNVVMAKFVNNTKLTLMQVAEELTRYDSFFGYDMNDYKPSLVTEKNR